MEQMTLKWQDDYLQFITNFWCTTNECCIGQRRLLMMNERYPVDLVISLQDFNASNWKDSIAQATREGYPAM